MRRRSRLGLIAACCLALILVFGRNQTPSAGFLGSYGLKSLRAEGLSGLWIAPDGKAMIAISDRSFAIEAMITRDEGGRIEDITLTGRTPLVARAMTSNGAAPLDSEGLALGSDGTIYISAEGPARVLRLPTLSSPGEQIGGLEDFGRLRRNGSLEALAIGPDGTLYTLPETSARDTGPFPVFSNAGDGWRVFAEVPREGGFLPCGADIGPDGQLYILFRGFSLPGGFSSRLQRFSISGQGLGPAQTLIDSRSGLHGNLEGVSIWRDALGRLTATMVSDDNGNFFQSASLVEYQLPD
jgi:hypothetical protein